MILIVDGEGQLRLAEAQERQPRLADDVERESQLLASLIGADGCPRLRGERKRLVVIEPGGRQPEWAAIIDERHDGVLTVQHQPLVGVIMLLQDEAALAQSLSKTSQNGISVTARLTSGCRPPAPWTSIL